jgi:hypothetical protein
VINQLRRFQRDGVTHMGIVFLGETMEELFADMELFARRVVPAFALGHVAGGAVRSDWMLVSLTRRPCEIAREGEHGKVCCCRSGTAGDSTLEPRGGTSRAH